MIKIILLLAYTYFKIMFQLLGPGVEYIPLKSTDNTDYIQGVNIDKCLVIIFFKW